MANNRLTITNFKYYKKYKYSKNREILSLLILSGNIEDTLPEKGKCTLNYKGKVRNFQIENRVTLRRSF